ncbi:hypothetical protein SSP24_56190 [Streptomyces spinoverrucosus]|uniref:Uncharacterized protein n=1 Tax=Streptomyces spinoverrucosus TaxID=284043 RepID=A0A4Y3VM16_9ACTN|nr:hypothetical protein SSP24_56190 [Streptomyces spinoverrucosus]GHB89445.1 hypothetical protein GCM10010397_72010 [Streptomyces spinoverrucosus]
MPGLAAKDCADTQVRVAVIDEVQQVGLLAAIGFRCRPEPWNRAWLSGGQECRKLVFAPPAGARRCNGHRREEDGPNARFAPYSVTTCAPMKRLAERGVRSRSACPSACRACWSMGRSRPSHGSSDDGSRTLGS